MQIFTRKCATTAAVLAGGAEIALIAGQLLWPASAEDGYGIANANEKVSEHKTFKPIEAITYAIGSNKLTGYFRPINGKCGVTLMLFRNIDPATSTPDNSASRVQTSVAPGETVLIDTAEGEGVQLNCDRNAETVTTEHFNRVRRLDVSKNLR